MNEFLPLFPLKLVAFPGENLHLHIFEPRYKQLIKDVLESDKVFGIPVFLKNSLEYGTTVKVNEVVKVYDNGKMDIKTVGQKIFRINKFINPVKGKIYAGGYIDYVQNIENGDPTLTEEIRIKLESLLSDINLYKHIVIKPKISVYKIVHIIGLTLEEEYEFLKIESELQRQLYILSQLERITPEVERVKEMKKRIMGNGHFKHHDPLQF